MPNYVFGYIKKTAHKKNAFQINLQIWLIENSKLLNCTILADKINNKLNRHFDVCKMYI